MKTILFTLFFSSSQLAMAAIEPRPIELEVPHKNINNFVIETKKITDIINSLNNTVELVKEENALNWSSSLGYGQVNDGARITLSE